MTKAYIGDGVYVDLDAAHCVVLTTEDGYQTTNRIVLEPEVYLSLLRWFSRTMERRAQEAAEQN